MKKRSTEAIIVFIYSIYALALMFASTILGWPGWITPITSVGIVMQGFHIRCWAMNRSCAVLS